MVPKTNASPRPATMVAIRGVSCGIFAFWHSPPPHALRPSEAVCIRRRLPNPHVMRHCDSACAGAHGRSHAHPAMRTNLPLNRIAPLQGTTHDEKRNHICREGCPPGPDQDRALGQDVMLGEREPEQDADKEHRYQIERRAQHACWRTFRDAFMPSSDEPKIECDERQRDD